jgi:hypothetical protein
MVDTLRALPYLIVPCVAGDHDRLRTYSEVDQALGVCVVDRADDIEQAIRIAEKRSGHD